MTKEELMRKAIELSNENVANVALSVLSSPKTEK